MGKYRYHIEQFELDYKTLIIDRPDGSILWVVDGNTHIIKRMALGCYKRASIDFYRVLVYITNCRRYRGDITTAKKIIKRLRSGEL